jgi:hypothetical protein
MGRDQEDLMETVDRGRMRSGTLAVVALATALAAAGCGGSAATPAIIFITPPPATLAPGATPTPGPPPPEISSTVISTSAPDGRWTVIFKKPVVGSASSDVAAKINDAITNKVNGYISTFTSGSLPAVASGETASTLDGNFSIALDATNIVSLRFTIMTFVSGSAHPVGSAGALNFVASTGATIALGDLFANASDAVKILADKTHAALTASLGSDLSWPSSANDIAFYEKAWAITAAGLEFTWGQGELASSAAGTPSAVVSWPDLKSVLTADGPLAGLAG